MIASVHGGNAAVYRRFRRLSTFPRGGGARRAFAMSGTTDPLPGKTVLLVGLMGAGKSAIGRRLAKALGRPFVDSDREIEEAAGCSIEDIFALHGEAAFRDCERRVMARLLSGPPCVLAAGGGAFMDPETRARAGKTAVSVWLRADIAMLLERVSRRDNRPLLKEGDKRATLERLMKEREPTYAQADIIVDSSDGPHEATVERLVELLAAHARKIRSPSRAAAGAER